MESGLRITYLWSDIDVVKINISASNGRFAGAADTYVAPGMLSEVAERLERFPSATSDSREMHFGEIGPHSAGGAAALKFYCSDRAGHICLELSLETDSTSAKPFEQVRMSLSIEAAAVDQFVSELKKIESEQGYASLRALTNG